MRSAFDKIAEGLNEVIAIARTVHITNHAATHTLCGIDNVALWSVSGPSPATRQLRKVTCGACRQSEKNAR